MLSWREVEVFHCDDTCMTPSGCCTHAAKNLGTFRWSKPLRIRQKNIVPCPSFDVNLTESPQATITKSLNAYLSDEVFGKIEN